MTDGLDFEARLAERLRAHAAVAARPFDAAAIGRQAVASRGRPWSIGELAWPSRRPVLGWLIVALLLAMAAIGAVAGIGALLRELGPGPLVWGPERFAQDWPAPVRAEPLSGGESVPMELGEDARWDPEAALWGPFQHSDVIGDVGRDDRAWLDIQKVHLDRPTYGASFSALLVGELLPPIPSPDLRWIAYGVVLDTNRDGVADVRLGMDNMPDGHHRAWRTDLASGQTIWSAGPPYGYLRESDEGDAGVGLDSYYPGEDSSGAAHLRYSVQEGELPLRFYVWASVIERGRVIATDYAPDAGWLEEGSQPALTLVGPEWEIERVSDSGNSSFDQALRFTADGKVHLDTGCYYGDANVTVEPGALRLSELVLGPGHCRTGWVAQASASLIRFLSSDQLAYAIDGGKLELRAGSETLTFTARYYGPPEGS
jgi:hypothetical protein